MAEDQGQDPLDNGPRTTRRTLLGTGIAGGAGVLLAGTPAAADHSRPEPAEWSEAVDGQVTAREGTNISVSVSPNGRWIATDAQGCLWIIPRRGGRARRVGTRVDLFLPRWIDDDTLVVQAYISGFFQLCRVRTDGTRFEQLTTELCDHREPSVSPDRREIAFSTDLGGQFDIHVLDLRTRAVRPWPGMTAADESQPAWSPDGDEIAFVVNGTEIVASDADG
ncbi:TolB family protein, partial [Streptomyces sp. NPDC055078]